MGWSPFFLCFPQVRQQRDVAAWEAFAGGGRNDAWTRVRQSTLMDSAMDVEFVARASGWLLPNFCRQILQREGPLRSLQPIPFRPQRDMDEHVAVERLLLEHCECVLL